MNINIYYGGRGLIDDPTLYVLSKIEEVLKELRVGITRYNLFDIKSSIPTLAQTLKDCDGIIIAASVEWLGIGGYLQEFLDACWLYGDKKKIANLYMSPVVLATTYGEKEAYHNLRYAWELLGGKVSTGICAYVEDNTEFELNREYAKIIEKKAENMYRRISQNTINLPTSINAIKTNILKNSVDLTPQESEQLSKYVADDNYVNRQKEDIEELSNLFKNLLSEQGTDIDQEFINDFKKHFKAQSDFKASYMFMIEDKKRYLSISVANDTLSCKYEKNEDSDVIAKLKYEVLSNIVNGRISFQRAFMTGEMTAKGNFNTLRMLDQLFEFI